MLEERLQARERNCDIKNVKKQASNDHEKHLGI